MDNLTVNLAVRCSTADLEIIDRLRANRSRAAFLQRLLREAGEEAAPGV